MAYDTNNTRVNPEIDGEINEFIEKNPKTFQRFTDLVNNDPERAVRSLIHKEMTIKAYVDRDRAGRELYKQASDEVVSELLNKKENKQILENLKSKFKDMDISKDRKHNLMIRDARAILENKGVNLRPLVQEKITEMKEQKAAGPKVG